MTTMNLHQTILVLVVCETLLPSLASSLLQIPDNVVSHSQYLHSSPSELELYDVEEFTNINEGSIRLELIDDCEQSYDRSPTLSYFRLREATSSSYIDHDTIILFKKDRQICSLDHLNEWPLRSLSQLMELTNTKEQLFAPMSRAIAGVSIGPIGLLRFVHNNARLFKLESNGFSHTNLIDNYYFSTTLIDLDPELKEGDKEFMKIVVTLPTRYVSANVSIDNQDETKLKIGSTLLSEIETKEHISTVTVFRGSTQKQIQLLNSSSSFELVNVNHVEMHDLDRLLVFFKLVQESSIIGRHLGQLSATDEQVVESNPFSLPPGCGCGLWLPNVEPVFVLARQFSGRFRAHLFSDQYYVAFDEQSGHLRYDSIGESKMVYSLHEHSVTLISADASRERAANVHDDQAHCAQYVASADKRTSKLLASLTIGQMLGVGPNIGLVFLGTSTTDDNLVCQVFEREVPFDEIPALVLVHSRPNLKPTDRFFLNFYFVAQPTHSSQSDRFERMLLRMIRLISYNDMRDKHMESQLTFDEFSWSLDVGVDEHHSELEHPVRVFDTAECSSQQAQSRVEFALQQSGQSEWKFSTDMILRDQFEAQTNQFELALVHILEQKSRCPRSKINLLGVLVPEQTNDLLVSFILSKPMKFEYTSTLMGWILQVNSVTEVTSEGGSDGNGKTTTLPAGELVKLKMSTPLEECALRLASSVSQGQQYFYMLHCPYVGCGYIRSYKWKEVKYIERNTAAQEPSLESYASLCSIHLVDRKMSASSLVSTYYSDDKLMENLNTKSVNIPLLQIKERSASFSLARFDAKITNLTVMSNLRHEQWDDELLRGECFTVRTRLKANGNFDNQQVEVKLREFNKNLKIIQLDFDKHHSLRQCHQACLQHAFCRTYTYNSQTHQCTLTSLDRSLIKKPEFQLANSMLNLSCKMLALNQIKRYKQKQISLAVKPSSLLGDKRPLLVASLDTCASLCHRNEFKSLEQKSVGDNKRKERCLRFIYLRSHSLCHLMSGDDLNPWGSMASAKISHEEDPFEYGDHLIEADNEQHGWLMNLDELDHYMSKAAARTISHCEIFERDYRSHFLVKPNLGLSIKEADGSRAVGERPAPVAKKLTGLTLNDCIRECAIVDVDCFALDYQVDAVSAATGGTSYDQICVLYHFRSPYSFAADQVEISSKIVKLRPKQPVDAGTLFNGLKLLPIEEKLYLANREDHTLSVRESTGWHYYISGDQLYLKRLQSMSATNSGQLEDEVLQALADEDEQK